MRIFHSPLDLVTYKYCAVSRCSCEMLWPKLDKNHSTQVDKFSKILFWEELTVFLSVCTIYFLNIKGCGNLLSRQSSFSFLSMHSTCKVLYCLNCENGKAIFYHLYVFVCVMTTKTRKYKSFFILMYCNSGTELCIVFFIFLNTTSIWSFADPSQTSKNFLAMFATPECIKNSMRK